MKFSVHLLIFALFQAVSLNFPIDGNNENAMALPMENFSAIGIVGREKLCGIEFQAWCDFDNFARFVDYLY